MFEVQTSNNFSRDGQGSSRVVAGFFLVRTIGPLWCLVYIALGHPLSMFPSGNLNIYPCSISAIIAFLYAATSHL
ncbi:hypothetical protein L210DRAFT_442461 [Boletus edulis BED1]|uniref:Uncharacterized protein n=1 Tax=Boletus edulis BED1 TaxID=1328754 RepID=A0AAD4BCK7_BOLED|nr:hypothetical protein L210DRAFT_2468533 [Boletus edulis BED1]KAF8441772.1 hypothetical protein L210DRAFT_442461 [Boletus edulis BED1]